MRGKVQEGAGNDWPHNHNPRVGGSNPSSATNHFNELGFFRKPTLGIYRHCVGTVGKRRPLAPSVTEARHHSGRSFQCYGRGGIAGDFEEKDKKAAGSGYF